MEPTEKPQQQLSSICKYIDSLQNEKDAEFLYGLKTLLHDTACVFKELRDSGKISESKMFSGASTTFGNICISAGKFLAEKTPHECRKYSSIAGKCMNCGRYT